MLSLLKHMLPSLVRVNPSSSYEGSDANFNPWTTTNDIGWSLREKPRIGRLAVRRDKSRAVKVGQNPVGQPGSPQVWVGLGWNCFYKC